MTKRTTWTLADIRAITDEDELGRAAAYYAVTHNTVKAFEAAALKSTLQHKAREMLIDLGVLNQMACDYFADAVKNFERNK